MAISESRRRGICSIADCQRPHKGRGFCRLHLERFRKSGDPHVRLRGHSYPGEPLRWLHDHADYSSDECLIWPFARKNNGYANRNGESPLKIMCAQVNGPQPSPKHQVAHSCGKGHEGCISPKHLRWATPKENANDKWLHGTMRVGFKLPHTKIGPEGIAYIRGEGASEKTRDLAKRFGCSPGRINFYRRSVGQPVSVFRRREAGE